VRLFSLAYLGVAFAALAVSGCSRAAAALPDHDRADAATGFAVVELFTSEGCSSCPPADKVLSEIAEEAKRSGRHVYPLAFHVDYWNELGWRDPFSSAWATNRQRAYGQAFEQRGMYTPQMIVNGRDAFVGSDRQRALRTIEADLAERAVAEIELRSVSEPSGIGVTFAVSAAPADAKLHVALVELATESKVTAGENAGRTLRHANVVRQFRTVSLEDGARGHISFPSRQGAAPEKFAVIAYLQDSKTMAIVGAARADL